MNMTTNRRAANAADSRIWTITTSGVNLADGATATGPMTWKHVPTAVCASADVKITMATQPKVTNICRNNRKASESGTPC